MSDENNITDGRKGNGPGKGDTSQIRIDRTHYKVKEAVLTGADLRKLPEPDIGPDRDLFEVVPGGSDVKVELDAQVRMRDGMRFFTAPAQINPGRI